MDVTTATCDDELGDALSLSANSTSATIPNTQNPAITNTKREIKMRPSYRFHELTFPECFGVVPDTGGGGFREGDAPTDRGGGGGGGGATGTGGGGGAITAGGTDASTQVSMPIRSARAHHGQR